MITVVETTKKSKTLNTPEEIADFLRRHYRATLREGSFKPGEALRITSRAGIPPDICIGDRVVVLFESNGGHVAHVLALNGGGLPVQTVVQLSSLARIDEEAAQ